MRKEPGRMTSGAEERDGRIEYLRDGGGKG